MTELTELQQLKSQAYDLLRAIEGTQYRLQQVNDRIRKIESMPKPAVKPEKPDEPAQS